MGAVVVGHVELAVQIVHREHEARGLDLQRGAGRDLVGAAEIDTTGHGTGLPR